MSLYDAAGRLLLGAGIKITSQQQFAGLQAQSLFVDEAETGRWKRRVQAAMESKLQQGATLGEVAAARPEPEQPEEARRELTLHEQWELTSDQLNSVLRDVRPGSDWQPRLHRLQQRITQLVARRPDASLYCLMHKAGQNTAKYSSGHALLTATICRLCGPLLGWDAQRLDTLTLAAMTMNVSMLRLQDHLAQSLVPLTPAERAEIDSHAQASVDQLQAAGMDDPLCLEVVRTHHDPGPVHLPLAALEPAQQLARLLRRVDIFAAKVSRRASRLPMSPVQAAREAVLGPDGKPDEVGAAMLRGVGMYPPGGFVQLSSGEVGIVLARGQRANLPVVASLVSASGEVLLQPLLRECGEGRHTVQRSLRPDMVKVLPPHSRLLAMR